MIYIIGSLAQANDIKKVAESLNTADVKYVKHEANKSFEECVKQCFDNIEQCSELYVVSKNDGSLGQGATYEVEYAKRLDKKITITKPIWN